MKGMYFLGIGIVTISLFGLGCFSGMPNKIPIPSGTEPGVELAKEDLAKRMDIDKEEIVVVEIESVDWPDTGLGCPEPGRMYAQVITPGYKIMLSYEEKLHEYHSDKEKRVVYCESRYS